MFGAQWRYGFGWRATATVAPPNRAIRRLCPGAGSRVNRFFARLRGAFTPPPVVSPARADFDYNAYVLVGSQHHPSSRPHAPISTPRARGRQVSRCISVAVGRRERHIGPLDATRQPVAGRPETTPNRRSAAASRRRLGRQTAARQRATRSRCPPTTRQARKSAARENSRSATPGRHYPDRAAA